MFFDRDMRKANVVTTISRGTADRLQTHFGLAVQGIAVPAVSALFRPCSGTEVASVLEKHGLEAPYLLAVGTLEPRKNFLMLLDAFVLMKKRYPSLPHKLALVGGKGWKNSPLTRKISELGKGQVHHLGYIGDQDLPCVYSGASAFIFPSRYEGFGIPVLEARACGTPIIASDLPEIREAGGNGPVYITPSIESLSAAVSNMLLSGGGIGDSRELPTWRAAGEVLADLFQREYATANNFKAATYVGY